MKNTTIKSVLVSVIALSGVYIAQTANSFTIDNFNSGLTGAGLTANNNNTSNSTITQTTIESNTGDILGVARDIGVVVANPSSFDTNASARTSSVTATPSGAFIATRSDGGSLSTYSIVWDGNTNNILPLAPNFSPNSSLAPITSGLGSVDFTGSLLNPNVAIRFDIVSFNDIAAGSAAKLTLWSNGGFS